MTNEWDDFNKKGAEPAKTKKEVTKTSTTTGKEEDKLKWSDEKIKQWLFGDTEKSSSNVCCALYGFDGTAKSGIALDCRTEEEKKEGCKIIVFDLDGGCAPLKVIYHDNDPNIIIKNPLVRDEIKNVDYEATFTKLKAAIDFVERNIEKMKIKAIVFDGLDKFLKICEYSMRDAVGKGVEDGVDYRYWKIRNQKYHDVLEQLKLLDVDRYFITHMKKFETDDDWIPDWEKKTPDIMFQKLLCFRETKVVDGDKVTYLKAKIEKCKTNLALEGRIYTIAEIWHKADGQSEAKWHGFYFNKDNTVAQKGIE